MPKQKKSVKIKSENMLFAGFGGQGIMFMGKLIAQSGLNSGLNVTWMPSYGAEVRGGTAYSMTKVSDGEIASPVVTAADMLVVMNRPSLEKYQGIVKDGGFLISNKSLVGDVEKKKGITTLNIPMTELAHKMGDAKIANMIALGAVIKRSKMLSLRNALAALEGMLRDREKLYQLNKAALEKGYKW